VELVSVAEYEPSPLSATALSEPAVVDSVTVPPLEVRSFPFASFAWTVIVEVEDPSAVIDAGEAEIVVVEADTAPGENWTVGSPVVIAEPAIVPDTVAVPAVVELVSVAVYVPSLLSVSALSVPSVLESVTVEPPDVTLFPFASCAWTVIAEVDVPFAVIDAGEAEIVVWDASGAPGVNCTVGSPVVIAEPAIVPDTVAVPAVVELVSVAEYEPLLLSVTALSVPAVVDSVTVPPLAVRSFPFASFAWTVTDELEDPSAVTEAGDAEIVEVEADTAPGENWTVGSPLVIAEPPIVPDTVAVPAVVELVSVAEYEPSPLSATALSEPSVVESTTVPPPDVSLFPLASFAWTVIAEVEDPSAVIDAGEAEIVVVEADTAPGENWTVGSPLVIAEPPIVPETVAVPAVVELVSVAEYEPSPLSVTALRVPAVVDSVTVPPLEVRSFPFASVAWTVTDEVEDPSDVIDAGEAEIVVVEASGAPGVNWTVGSPLVIAEPPTVPDTVAVPVVVELVSVAVYVPSLLSVAALSVPSVLESVTVEPPDVTLFPFASFAWTVIVDVDVPFAVIDAGEAEIVVVEASGAPGVNWTVGSPLVIAEPPIVPDTVAVPAVVELVSVAE
jgi:hypothetical protein